MDSENILEKSVPILWDEDPVPEEMVDCRKCELLCQRSRVIWGEGNSIAPIIVILDNPGAREDREGNPFVCGTRQTLQEAVHKAGLSMEDLYVTYILKCRPKRSYDKELARDACFPHLEQQLQKQRPRLAVCLGNTAVQWFFGDMEAEVKALRGTWHQARGIPALAAYHPLAVRRRPNLMRLFEEDWKAVKSKLDELSADR